MLDNFISFIGENIILFDVIFFILIGYFAIQCFAKGFFLSLMSFLKWVLALIITIILVPKFEPYISNYIDNQYVVGIGLGIFVYIISLFILILLGRSLGKLFAYTGVGSVDKTFGFFLKHLKQNKGSCSLNIIKNTLQICFSNVFSTNDVLRLLKYFSKTTQ